MKLNVIITSTRPNRVGPKIGGWFADHARTRSTFDVELVDLASFDLPVFDEPNHPAMGNYQHAHTHTWSQSVVRADAFVFVTPEYNYGPPPSLLNALNFLYREWNYAPAGIVSYGGVSGGTRAAEAIKTTLCALKMMPIPEGVAIPNVSAQLGDTFVPSELNLLAAQKMLPELAVWAEALADLRAKLR